MKDPWSLISALAAGLTAINYLFKFAGVLRHGVGYWSKDRKDLQDDRA